MLIVRNHWAKIIGVLLLLLLLLLLLSASGMLARYGSRIAARRDIARRPAPAVAATDIPSNGPTALQPQAADPGPVTLTMLLGSRDDLSVARELLASSGLLADGALPQPATLLLPHDAAFFSLPIDALQALRADPDAQRRLLRYHVVAGEVAAAELGRSDRLSTVAEQAIPIERNAGGVGILNGATPLSIDLKYETGIVHVIDQLLLPPSELQPPLIETPDNVEVVEFIGGVLTVVGQGEPNTLIDLQNNGQRFGSALVNGDGRWQLSGAVGPGENRLRAYMLDPGSKLPLAVSKQVTVIVAEEG